MITKIVFFFCAQILFVSSAFAGGSIQLKGKVRSFDKQMLEVADNHYIYKVDRRFIASVSNPKSGQDIEMMVPFNAITDVKKTK